MNERHLYRGLNNFEGSIDEEGNLYDERRAVGIFLALRMYSGVPFSEW